MKKIKNYIDTDLAKKKVARYKYWSIRDEAGIVICSSDDESEERSFSEILDRIISDNVDAEVSVKFGTTDQSARQNAPFFIRINEEIEWVEPEEETVQINGVPHRVDKNGNVNINLTAPKNHQENEVKVEPAQIDYFRQEMDMQLSGLRKEYELKEEKWQMEMGNKLLEQTLKFKEMMIAERESRLTEREQTIAQREAELGEREEEIRHDVKGYLKQVPSALGSVIKELIKDKPKKDGLGKAEKEERQKQKEEREKNRKPVSYTIEEEPEEENQKTESREDETELEEQQATGNEQEKQ